MLCNGNSESAMMVREKRSLRYRTANHPFHARQQRVLLLHRAVYKVQNCFCVMYTTFICTQGLTLLLDVDHSDAM